MALRKSATCGWNRPGALRFVRVAANVQHMLNDMALTDGGLGLAYHGPRLAFQPVLIWLALWAGEATDWPLARRRFPTK